MVHPGSMDHGCPAGLSLSGLQQVAASVFSCVPFVPVGQTLDLTQRTPHIPTPREEVGGTGMASETVARARSPNALDGKGLEEELKPSFSPKSRETAGGWVPLCVSPRRLLWALGVKGPFSHKPSHPTWRRPGPLLYLGHGL